MHVLSADDANYRLKLYEQGLNDREIAGIIGITNMAIYGWRKRNNLSPNVEQGWKRLSKDKAEYRMHLHKQGLSDTKIAKIIGIHTSSFNEWRQKNNLEPNFKPYKKKATHEQKLEAYKQGLNDREIADYFNLNYDYIHTWRKQNNLSPNFDVSIVELNFKPTRELGYFVGLVLGDGCIQKYKRWHITKLSSPFRRYVDLFEEMGKKLFPQLKVTRAEWMTKANCFCKERKKCYCAIITSKRLFEFLSKFKNKGDKWNIQANYPNEFYYGIVAGLIDSDGWIDKSNVGISNKHENNLIQIKNILKEAGFIYGAITIKKRKQKIGGHIHLLRIYGQKNLSMILEKCKPIYKEEKLSRELKKIKIKYTGADYFKVLELKKKKHTLPEISKITNVKIGTIRSWIYGGQKPLFLTLAERHGGICSNA